MWTGRLTEDGKRMRRAIGAIDLQAYSQAGGTTSISGDTGGDG